MTERLEEKAGNAILEIKKKVCGIFEKVKAVPKIYEILRDLGMKLTHVIEHKFDYHTLPENIDYSS